MKVQKIKTNGKTCYLLLGNNYERFPEVDAWVKFLTVKDASPGTIRTYLYNLMPYYEFLEGIGVKPLEIYDPEDPHRAHEIMMEFSLHLSDPKMSTTAINGKAPKDHTNEGVNRIISTVCNFYESLQMLQIYDVPLKFTKTVSGSKYLTGNPLAELFFSGKTVKKNLYKRPTVEKPVEFITRPQYSELFFALKNSRDRLAAAMMFECGMRAAEVCGLKWEDLDRLEDNMIKIVFRPNNENGARVKYRENRVVPAPDYVVDMLLEYLDQLETHERDAGVSISHGFVLSGERRGADRPISYSAVYDAFRRVSKVLGWHVHPHMLRHGFANEKLACGLDPNEVRVLMGHKHVSTTMNSYISSAALMSDQNFKSRLMLSNYAFGGIQIDNIS